MTYLGLGSALVGYDWRVVRVVFVGECSTFGAAMVRIVHYSLVLLLLLRQCLSLDLLYTSDEVVSGCRCLLALVEKRDDHLI